MELNIELINMIVLGGTYPRVKAIISMLTQTHRIVEKKVSLAAYELEALHWLVISCPLSCFFHQKFNGTLPTDPKISCDRAIRYSGLGVRETWVLWVRFLGFLQNVMKSTYPELVSSLRLPPQEDLAIDASVRMAVTRPQARYKNHQPQRMLRCSLEN